MSHQPTPEQAAIIRQTAQAPESLMVTAYAGCAKTSTLVMASRGVKVPTLALAFNKKIKDELERVLPPEFTVKTMNGLGHSAWGRAIGKKLNLDDRKLAKLITQVTKEAGYEISQDEWGDIRALVSRAMLWGLVPSSMTNAKGLVPDSEATWLAIADDVWIDDPKPRMLELARAILLHSIKQGYEGNISFDDQLYLPTMFGGQFSKFPLVMVDESQDLSPLNHIQVAKSASGRVIAVGDPRQAIYQFRGADSQSMTTMRKLKTQWLDLPLLTTFRCPKIVVERQQSHAPGFVAWHTNQQGAFSSLLGKEWSMGDFPTEGSIALLCRNNAPLVKMAFKLIRQGIGCTMLGRDIGKGLEKLLHKLCPEDTTPALKCAELIAQWMERETDLARASGKESKIARITDQGECLLAVLESHPCRDRKDLERALISIFQENGGRVVLSTGHRAKGLEWDTVIHLDPWRIPSKFAMKDPSQMEQEKNLAYVIDTRTRHTLVEANVEDFK